MRPSDMEEVANLNNVLAQMQRSGSIYFVKSLPKTAIPTRMTNRKAELVLPAEFIRENQDKIQECGILRVQSSLEISLRPWAVRLSVSLTSSGCAKVRIVGGWTASAAGNHLKEGGSLIFLLRRVQNQSSRSVCLEDLWGQHIFQTRALVVPRIGMKKKKNTFRTQKKRTTMGSASCAPPGCIEHKTSIQSSHHNIVEHF